MSGLEADTIGDFNSMIEKQKKAEGEAFERLFHVQPPKSVVFCPLYCEGVFYGESLCENTILENSKQIR